MIVSRDSGSINAQTEVSWGYGSSRILQGHLKEHSSGFAMIAEWLVMVLPACIGTYGLYSLALNADNLSEAYSFPSIDDDDLIKFFPEKCEIEPAATIEAKPQLATQPASTSSPPSRFSVRSLIARLRATSPGNGGNTSNSSKSAVQTMSSVVISHRPDSASHTVVAAFDATRKLTFEAVDWGLLQMDLWPGDTLVVLGVITKIRSPLGVEVLADLDGFSGLNPRVLEHEVAQRLVDYQRKLLARRLYCQKKGVCPGPDTPHSRIPYRRRYHHPRHCSRFLTNLRRHVPRTAQPGGEDNSRAPIAQRSGQGGPPTSGHMGHTGQTSGRAVALLPPEMLLRRGAHEQENKHGPVPANGATAQSHRPSIRR